MRRAHLVNYTLYQIGWFACVLGGASHRPWTGCLIALTLVGVHLTRSLERSIEVLSNSAKSATLRGAILLPAGAPSPRSTSCVNDTYMDFLR